MVDLKEKLKTASEKLVRAKAAVTDAEAEWESIYQQLIYRRLAATPAGATNGRVKPLKGQAAKIVALLGSEPSKEWTYEEIERKLPDVKKESLRSFLFRLKRDEKVVKAGRGTWKMK